MGNKEKQLRKKLQKIDARLLYDSVKDEHLQVLAVLVGLLDPQKAGEFLSLFHKEVRLDIVQRASTLSSVSGVGLDMLVDVVQGIEKTNKMSQKMPEGSLVVSRILSANTTLFDEADLAKLRSVGPKEA